MNNFVTGLTPFLCKRASASRFDPTLMCMRYYDRSLILSKPVFRNRLDFRCFFAKNNGHTIQRDCVTVFISVVLPTLLRQLFIAPFMLMSAYDLDRLSRKAELFGISFCEKTDGEFLGKLKAALLNAEQSKLDNDFLKP